VTYLAERIEYVVEVNQDFALSYLCDVVHSFTRIVANSGILVREARKHWRNNSFEVLRQFLRRDVGMSSGTSRPRIRMAKKA
jgi:hypothetical protein